MKRPNYRSDFQAMDFALADEQTYKLGSRVVGGGAMILAAAASVEAIYEAPESVALTVSSGVLFVGAITLRGLAALKREVFEERKAAVQRDWAEFFSPSTGLTEDGAHLDYPSAIPADAYELAGELQ